MADTTINVRLRQKIDTYDNWNRQDTAEVYGNLVLKAGEMAIVLLPASTTEELYGYRQEAVMYKVGDGIRPFKQLPWGASTAIDVPTWARQKDKPVYLANEIAGLQEYISAGGGDTDTMYSIRRLSATKYELVCKGKNDENYETILDSDGDPAPVYIEIPDVNSAEVAQIQQTLDTLTGTGEGSISNQIATEIATIVADAPEDFDNLKKIADYLQNSPSDVAQITSDITTLKGQAHTHTNKTVLDGITSTQVTSWSAAEQNAKEYTDNKIRGLNLDSIIGEGVVWRINCGTSTTVL